MKVERLVINSSDDKLSHAVTVDAKGNSKRTKLTPVQEESVKKFVINLILSA